RGVGWAGSLIGYTRRGTINLAVSSCTHLVPLITRLCVRLLTIVIPRSVRDREGVIPTTSLSTRSASPGLVGFGQASSPPAPMIPPISGNPLSTSSKLREADPCSTAQDRIMIYDGWWLPKGATQ